MNEDLILKMVAPHLKGHSLTYEQFDKVFNMLSLREQYQVCEILHCHGILLCDEDIEQTQSIDDDVIIDLIPEETVTVEEKPDSSFEVLKDATEFVIPQKTVKQSNETLLFLVGQGSSQAKSDLCIKNERLVLKYANSYFHYFGNDLDFDDLVQAGYIGLLKAAEKFNAEKDSSFSTYAVFWIRQSILREIMDYGFRIRIPVHLQEIIHKTVSLDAKFSVLGYGFEERINMISDELELPKERIIELLSIKNTFMGQISLDTPIDEDGESMLGDFIPDEESVSVEDICAGKELRLALEKALGTLTPREEKVIRLRYGFEDGRRHTLEEVGKEFNVTRERIRQIQEKSLRKLRHPTRSRNLRGFL